MHDVRIAYLVSGEKPIMESEFLPSAGGGCPITGKRAPTGKPEYPLVKFGRLFPPRRMKGLGEERLMEIAHSLIRLGKCMDDPRGCHDEDLGAQTSNIPAGYTYLGQFITHEVTFLKTDDLPLVDSNPLSGRSPNLDLDSLYGGGPATSAELYESDIFPARLKVGWTQPPILSDSSQRSPFPEFQNDLPRKGVGERKERGVAIIGDARNDENLPLAQTHVAFLKFHNRVVEDLKAGHYRGEAPPAGKDLFERAREEVVKHFQWIVLNDYLPKIVDEDLVKSLIRKPSSDKFNFKGGNELFIPLEFSAAAFRIGHSMVRRMYTWNLLQGDVPVEQLFTHTKLSGDLGSLDRLDSRWVIDWKNFYDFSPFAGEFPPQDFNRAGKIDTTFDFRLDKITGFRHLPQPQATNGAGERPDGKKPANPLFNGEHALPVRNLLRGLSLGLPWGEDVADALKEQRLERDQLRDGAHAQLLDAEAFFGKTPLWFYILKESKWRGVDGRLGPVGGRIVAETLIGLIRHGNKKYSILKQAAGNESEWELSDWRPAPEYRRQSDEPEGVKFEMVDLLRAADVVDPLGRFRQSQNP